MALARIPYKTKMTRVMAIKIALSPAICLAGETPSGETKSGKKARKKSVSLGFRMLIRMPFTTIWTPLTLRSGLVQLE